MSNPVKVHANNGLPVKETNYNAVDKVHGVNNWILVFFVIFSCNLVIENYMSYGIVKGPFDIIIEFIKFMEANWSCYALIFLGYLFQILLCFLNEKLLALELLPEKIGTALHVFISLFLFNLCTVLFRIYDLNAAAGIVIMAHVFLTSLKFWAYAYENKIWRNNYLRNKSAQTHGMNGNSNSEIQAPIKNTLKYPQNVTLKNLLEFLFCSGACLYKINGLKKNSTNFKKVLQETLKTIAIFYSAAFLLYQFLLPEADKAVSYMVTGQYFEVFRTMLKMALPVDLVWLLFFYFYCLQIYLPVFGWIWGTEDIVLGRDWWNSENSSIFWTTWNYQVHIWLKEYFFLPVLQMGYSKRTAALVVTFVSGFLHEYLITVPCRTCYGIAMFAMISQIPLADVTSFVHRTYGGKWGNLLFWAFFILSHSACTIFVYYNYATKT